MTATKSTKKGNQEITEPKAFDDFDAVGPAEGFAVASGDDDDEGSHATGHDGVDKQLGRDDALAAGFLFRRRAMGAEPIPASVIEKVPR